MNWITFPFRGAIATAQAAGWICEYVSCKTKSWVLNIQCSQKKLEDEKRIYFRILILQEVPQSLKRLALYGSRPNCLFNFGSNVHEGHWKKISRRHRIWWTRRNVWPQKATSQMSQRYDSKGSFRRCGCISWWRKTWFWKKIKYDIWSTNIIDNRISINVINSFRKEYTRRIYVYKATTNIT